MICESQIIPPDKIEQITYFQSQPTRNRWGRIEDNSEYNKAGIYREKAFLLTHVESTTYENRQILGKEILKMATIYNNKTIGYFAEIENTETDTKFKIPLYNRFSQEYIQKQIDLLYNLHWRRPANYFLTLTLSFKKFHTLYDGKQAMMSEWNRLLTWIKKYDKKAQFLGIREIQLKHTKNIHMHILISCKLDYDLLLYMVQSLGIGTQEDLKSMVEYFYDKNGRFPSNHELWYMSIQYILKYMKKDTENEQPETSENWTILWALRARVFSKSQSLQPAPRPCLDTAFQNNSTGILKKFMAISLFYIRASRFNPDFYNKPANPIFKFLGIVRTSG